MADQSSVDESLSPNFKTKEGKSPNPVSRATSQNADPTTEPGQYPVGDWGTSIFGGPLPDGTGAPGSQGARISNAADATNMPGQTEDGLTGISEDEITQTGAPGTQGVVDRNGGSDTINYTEAGDGITPYRTVTTSDSISGPEDWTSANDGGYATGGPQLPGLKGNEPQAGSLRYQPGGGRVLRGGRAVRP